MQVRRIIIMSLGAAALVGMPATLQQAVGQGKGPLVKYKVVDDDSIPKSLTGKPGDPKKGRKWVVNRKLGNCLACHILPVNQPYMGKIGPSLIGAGSRYNPGQLRLRVVNMKLLNGDTLMPGFYRVKGLKRVHKKFKGKTILSAQQVEDIVAYLSALKEKK